MIFGGRTVTSEVAGSSPVGSAINQPASRHKKATLRGGFLVFVGWSQKHSHRGMELTGDEFDGLLLEGG